MVHRHLSRLFVDISRARRTQRTYRHDRRPRIRFRTLQFHSLVAVRRAHAALGHFREAVRLSPRSVTALGNLGAALGVAGRIDEAVAHFRQALQIDPGNEAARRNLELALERR